MLEFVFFAPVTQRAWILPTYFDRIRSLNGVNPRNTGLVFLYGEPSSVDVDSTLLMLQQEAEEGGWQDFRIVIDETNDHSAKRRWNIERYAIMARLRNRLLEEVRDMKPHFAFSLDTDILLPPDALEPLVDDLVDEEFDGIAPLVYMTPTGDTGINAMDLKGEMRPTLAGGETVEVEACFAAVLMGMDLYQIDYAPHRAGEDLGWANNVARAGLRLGLCPRVKAKHVMHRDMLVKKDLRVGF